MKDKPALPRVFDRGIETEAVQAVRERFLALNQQRLLRIRSGLKGRQQLLLDLLPLLFHVNHPMLPGYSGAATPRGVDGFSPSAALVGRARQHLAASFVYRQGDKHPNHIHSIFLMGSSGTVAQSPHSDLDIWLCHRARLSPEALTLLQRKASGIASWAKTLGLEIHIFLMESEQFRRGKRDQLSAEAVGTSQHFLLLDEFYRSAVLLAGRYPIWWLVPPEEESNYAEYTAILRSQGFVDSDESIDFGGVADIPAGEFIGAGIWQLYKGISAPYKALLKLLLTEAYAREYPRVETLSLAFKRALYAGQAPADEVDPYVMVYHKLEHYLQARQEFTRLELVRRAFYFKTGRQLSSQNSTQPHWQQQLLQSLIRRWQWSPEQILNLDTQHRWKLRRVREEHQLLVEELTKSYHFLQEFAQRTRKPALINSQEMTLLGRKLYAAFERKRHKVEWLNPGIALDLSEEQLFFRAEGYADQRRWQVSNQPAQHSEDVLYRSEGLTELLCWCHCNGLISAASRLRLEGRHQGMDDAGLHQLSGHLKQFLPLTAPAVDPTKHAAFSHPKTPEAVLIYVNVGQDALSGLGGSGSPNADNAFPVARLEMVVVNSWGEVSSLIYLGPDTLIKAFRAYQQLILSGARSKRRGKLEIRCFNDPGQRLQAKLETLARDVYHWLNRSRYPSRFVVKLGNGFYILQSQDQDLKVQHAVDYPTLLQCLGRGQPRFSPIALERHCAADSILACISKTAITANCHIFCHQTPQGADIFLCDERGSLQQHHLGGASATQAMARVSAFLAACREEQQGNHTLKGYLLQRSSPGWQCKPLAAPDEETAADRPQLEAQATRSSGGRRVFDLRCDGKLFRYADHGSTQLLAVADYLRARYGPQLQQPQLQRLLLGERQQQSSVYLRYKTHLESLLARQINRA